MSKRAVCRQLVGGWQIISSNAAQAARLVGGVSRQGPGSPSVPGRPEGPALQLQHSSGQLDLQAPYASSTHRHTHTRRHTPTNMHGNIHFHLVLRGVKL
jgi:hypothetical protein